MAASLKRFLSMAMRPERSGNEKISSEVTSRMMAVMASHRLMSDIDRAKFVFGHPWMSSY